jgi:hypothetical protein
MGEQYTYVEGGRVINHIYTIIQSMRVIKPIKLQSFWKDDIFVG